MFSLKCCNYFVAVKISGLYLSSLFFKDGDHLWRWLSGNPLVTENWWFVIFPGKLRQFCWQSNKAKIKGWQRPKRQGEGGRNLKSLRWFIFNVTNHNRIKIHLKISVSCFAYDNFAWRVWRNLKWSKFHLKLMVFCLHCLTMLICGIWSKRRSWTLFRTALAGLVRFNRWMEQAFEFGRFCNTVH